MLHAGCLSICKPNQRYLHLRTDVGGEWQANVLCSTLSQPHNPQNTHHYYNDNKAIRDGKYLARHMPVLGNVHPIKIENVDIFFVKSFLCSLELLYY